MDARHHSEYGNLDPEKQILSALSHTWTPSLVIYLFVLK